MPFTVTSTGCNPLRSGESRLLLPRTDLDMKAQRKAAHLEERERFLRLVTKDFEATTASRGTHLIFLYQMCNEIQRYQLKTHQVCIPLLTMEILANQCYERMNATSKEDRYSLCLRFLNTKRCYTPDFAEYSDKLMEEFPKQQRNRRCV